MRGKHGHDQGRRPLCVTPVSNEQPRGAQCLQGCKHGLGRREEHWWWGGEGGASSQLEDDVRPLGKARAEHSRVLGSRGGRG